MINSFSGNGASLARLVAKRAGFPEVEREARKTDVQAVVRSVRSAMESNGLRDLLLPFDVPILLVHGGKDPLVHAPRREWLGGFGRNTRVVLLEGAAHFPMLEQQNKFNRLLMEFLRVGDNLDSLELKEEWQRRLR
jgi:pimeloyl-ACP methyl ester carboxylesterase